MEMHHRRVRQFGRIVASTLSAFAATDMAVALFRQRIRSNNTAAHLRGPETGLTGYGTRNNLRWQMLRTLEAWFRDFTHAARSLRRAPGFTIVTVATLALAIGANTAIFSVVDTVLLDPLDFPDADRLISIRASRPGFGPTGGIRRCTRVLCPVW